MSLKPFINLNHLNIHITTRILWVLQLKILKIFLFTQGLPPLNGDLADEKKYLLGKNWIRVEAILEVPVFTVDDLVLTLLAFFPWWDSQRP